MAATEQDISRALDTFRSTRAFREAQKALDFVAVCLIGFEGPAPAHVGDNRGRWPVRLAISRTPTDIAKKPDIESPLFPIVLLAHVWVESEAHARRLKGHLDELLLGEQPAEVELRHAWKDCPDPAVAWPILLEEARRMAGDRRETIEIFGERERLHRIVQHAQRRTRRA